jgi:hypothetical protein
MKGFARVLGAWGILTLIAGISPGSAVGQSALPPVPIMPSDPQGSFPDPGIPAAPSPPREPVGLDLRHLVGLFINESLGGGQPSCRSQLQRPLHPPVGPKLRGSPPPH